MNLHSNPDARHGEMIGSPPLTPGQQTPGLQCSERFGMDEESLISGAGAPRADCSLPPPGGDLGSPRYICTTPDATKEFG